MGDDETSPLWEFVPLAEVSAPDPPAAERVRGGLGRLWDRLRPSSVDEHEGELVQRDAPPREVLDKAAPEPSWSEAAQALESALGAWADGGNSDGAHVRVVVGPSGSAADDILGTWARSRGWEIIEPPGHEEILKGGKEWLDGVGDSDGPRVLRRLDQLYLRHHDGLELVERLIERLISSEECLLIGCGSWSWAYLSGALGVDAVLGQPVTLQAMDCLRLRAWLRQLAADRFSFCQRTEKGEAVVLGRDSDDRTTDGEDSEEQSDFLERLAAFSRGIPLVAWAVWRDSLHTEGSGSPAGDRETLWLPDFSELDLPEPAGSLGSCELAVLHELLLQGSTTPELLTRIVPFTTAELANGLHVLQRAGLLATGPNGLEVPLPAYPAARATLYEAGYQTASI